MESKGTAKRLNPATRLGAAVATIALAAGLAACSGGGQPGQPNLPELPELPAPEFVTTDNLHGAEITLHPESSLVIPVGEDNPGTWTEGSTDDENVAKFVPGTSQYGAKTNPGFAAVGEGTTDASIVDPKTGEVISFTITVK